MTSQQKAQLTDNAGKRAGRRTLIAQLIYPGISAVVIVGYALINLGRSSMSLQHRLIELGVAVVFAAFLGLMVWWLYHRARWGKQQPLVTGADRDTQREVRQALRDGQSSSPEIVELIADQRAHWRKQRKLVWLVGLIFAILLTAALLGRHTKDWAILGIVAVLYVVLIGHWLVVYRRLNRFRGTSS